MVLDPDGREAPGHSKVAFWFSAETEHSGCFFQRPTKMETPLSLFSYFFLSTIYNVKCCMLNLRCNPFILVVYLCMSIRFMSQVDCKTQSCCNAGFDSRLLLGPIIPKIFKMGVVPACMVLTMK